ncbi:MAG: 30S ribosomal protein S15 [Elusimicrobiota bacterium]|jgi:small subunit ribosomal protein S15|nr:30S ribosomal protein S15 [Elusimicrobiota bacterium]
MAFEKKTVVEKFKTHPTDTGSANVQIAILTSKIEYLSEHFKKFPKDFGSRAGFLKMIGQRRKLLAYVKKHNPEVYAELIKKLNLRK